MNASKEPKSLVIAGQTPGEVCATDAELATRSCNAVRVGVTWFGDKGPYAAWRGDDAVIQALSGIAYAFGLPRGPPTRRRRRREPRRGSRGAVVEPPGYLE